MALEDFSGRAPDPAPTAGNVLRADPSTQFHFLHHPLQWDVYGQGDAAVLLPRLRVFRLEPGVSGVIQVKGRNDGNGLNALAERKQDGWIEIPRGPVQAWGKEFPDYCLRYDGHRGPVHAEAWRKFTILGTRVVEEWDLKGWTAYLQGLVGKVIPDITSNVRRGLFLQMRAAGERRVSNDRNLGAVRRGEVYERRLAALEAERKPVAARQELPSVAAPPDMAAQLLAAIQGISQDFKNQAAEMARLQVKLDSQAKEITKLQGKSPVKETKPSAEAKPSADTADKDGSQ